VVSQVCFFPKGQLLNWWSRHSGRHGRMIKSACSYLQSRSHAKLRIKIRLAWWKKETNTVSRAACGHWRGNCLPFQHPALPARAHSYSAAGCTLSARCTALSSENVFVDDNCLYIWIEFNDYFCDCWSNRTRRKISFGKRAGPGLPEKWPGRAWLFRPVQTSAFYVWRMYVIHMNYFRKGCQI